MEEFKIIDWKSKGNAIRLILGKSDLETWWGDDWDDVPYEHNAGTVYEEFIAGTHDVFVPFDCEIYEPSRFEINSDYSREDMLKRKIPMFVIVRSNNYFQNYLDAINAAEICVFMGDNISNLIKLYDK